MDNRQDFESWDGGSNPSLGVWELEPGIVRLLNKKH